MSRQIEMLAELSKTGFELSHLRRCQDLYAAFTETISAKLGTDNVTVYIHEKKERMLRMAFNRGEGRAARAFKMDDHEIYHRMVQAAVKTRASIEADHALAQASPASLLPAAQR